MQLQQLIKLFLTVTMIWQIMANKVKKSKIDVQAYLNNTSQVRNSQRQTKQIFSPKTPTQSLQKTQTQSNNQIGIQNVYKSTKTQIQLQLVQINKVCYKKQKYGFWLYFYKQGSIIQILYEDKGVKFKIQFKKQQIVTQQIKKINEGNSFTLQLKLITIQNEDQKLSKQKGKTIWVNQSLLNKCSLSLSFKNKQDLKKVIQLPILQGLINKNLFQQNIISKQSLPIKSEIPQLQEQSQSKQPIKFSMPTKQQQPQSIKTQNLIRQMSAQDKTSVLIDVFKIKQAQNDQNQPNKNNTFQCPVNECDRKSYKEVSQLRVHLKMKHPQLAKHGMQLDDDGTFKYTNSKAIDLALYLGKMYPEQMKKIIKNTKTRKQE